MELELEKWYKLLAPRPAVLISTVNSEGKTNAAPFSFIMPLSSDPAMLVFASAPEHHTVRNIRETGDFVVNIPGRELLEKLWTCAKDFAYGVSEMEKAGLTAEKSQEIKSPYIKECAGFIECKLGRIEELGCNVMIIGDVVRSHLNDEFVKDGAYDILKASPLTHIGGPDFGILGSMARPK